MRGTRKKWAFNDQTRKKILFSLPSNNQNRFVTAMITLKMFIIKISSRSLWEVYFNWLLLLTSKSTATPYMPRKSSIQQQDITTKNITSYLAPIRILLLFVLPHICLTESFLYALNIFLLTIKNLSLSLLWGKNDFTPSQIYPLMRWDTIWEYNS